MVVDTAFELMNVQNGILFSAIRCRRTTCSVKNYVIHGRSAQLASVMIQE